MDAWKSKMQNKIAILMATYNGEKFLRKQLDSIENQTFSDWCLYVVDDGSTDSTYQILEEYKNKWGSDKIVLSKKQNEGCTKSFLTLVCDPNIKADYYAYSDHDDIWEPTKLQRAIDFLKTKDNSKPQLHCSSATIIDEFDNMIGVLPNRKKPLSLKNALVQSFGVGNAMLFNDATRNVLLNVGIMDFMGNHDWWTGVAVTAAGGQAYYDPFRAVLYRQHRSNYMGFSKNYFARYLKALKRVLKGDFKALNDCHMKALHKMEDKISADSKITLDFFKKSRQGNVLKRLFYLYRSGVYRQDLTGTLSVYIAQTMGKF